MLIFLIKSNIIYTGDMTMKKLLLTICALCLTQCAFAALDRDYFDYTQTPEYQAIPTDTSAAIKNTTSTGEAVAGETVTTTKKVKKTVKGKKRIRFGNEGSSWINTYWNFGQPNYGETGRF